MTCIVAVKNKGKVLMGADSAGIEGWNLDVRKDPKIYINGPFIFGFTSSFRMGQLLGHALNVPKRKRGESVEKFMVTTFIDALRECLKSGGFSKAESSVESGGTFIVGYQGRLFTVCDDYQVAEQANGFESVGCGHNIAKGSLYSTRSERSPLKRLKTALKAAEYYSAGVRGPFMFREH